MTTDTANSPNRIPRRTEPGTIRRAGIFSRLSLPTGPDGTSLRRLLDAALRVEGVAITDTPTGGPLERRTRRLVPEGDGPFGLPAAYELLVVQLLDAVGIPVLLTGRRPHLLPLPAWAADLAERSMLAAVAENERLVVRAGNGVEVAKLIVLVCRAFPGLRIVVLVKRVKDAQRIAHLLRKAGVAVSLFTGWDRDNRSFERVAVTTYHSSGDERVGRWDADLLLVHDAGDALGADGVETLRRAHWDHPSSPRVVGFAKLDFTPSLNQYAGMLSLYGLTETVVPAPGSVNRAVEYVLLPVEIFNSHAGLAPQGESNLGRTKSEQVWNNHARNRLVAKLACGFAEGKAETVRGRFPELAGHRLLGRHVSILVVVENGEHAAALLHGPLRGWFAIGPDVGRMPQPPSFGQSPRRLSPAVCTFAGLADLNVAGYDAVVRVDAGVGGLPLAPGALVTPDVAAEPLLFVDLYDRRHPVLAPLADGRRAAYEAAGWTRPGEVQRYRELDRFLARHPRGDSVRRRIVALAERFANREARV